MTRHVARTVLAPALLAVLGLGLAGALPLSAQTRTGSPASPSAALAIPTGPSWSDLSPGERQALLPLQAQWTGIDATRKQKWRDVATRYATLPPVQQARLHERMLEWATMTPAQRNTARISFEELRKLPATERQTRWEAYQSLPAEQRQALITQAGNRPVAASAPQAAAVRKTPSIDTVQAKSNIVNMPQPAIRPQPVAPGTVLAGVGASTRPISKPPTPPRHQQAGLPKIAATPEFVQNDTLLPQRGPQGAGAGPLTRPDVP
jgi:hypothetical protein